MIGFWLAAAFLLVAFLYAALTAPPAYRLLEQGPFGLIRRDYKKSWILRAGFHGYALLMSVNLLYGSLIGRLQLLPALVFLPAPLAFALASRYEKPAWRTTETGVKEERQRIILRVGFAFANGSMLLAALLFAEARALQVAFAILLFFFVVAEERAPKYCGLYEALAFLTVLVWPPFLLPHLF